MRRFVGRQSESGTCAAVRRSLLALFVAFQAIWLNVVVPGHTRGIVTLAGAACESSGARGRTCCAATSAHEKGKASPTSEQRARCAVCAFAARVTTPPVIDLVPGLSEVLGARPFEEARGVESVGLLLSYRGRAPPVGV